MVSLVCILYSYSSNFIVYRSVCIMKKSFPITNFFPFFLLLFVFVSPGASGEQFHQYPFGYPDFRPNTEFNLLCNLLISGNIQQDLHPYVIKGLVYLREEEKLARDIYSIFYSVFPLRPFENISKSEQAHMNAIKRMIDLYGLTDPVKKNKPGEFSDTGLLQIYHSLIEQGVQNKINALKTSAFIEEKDIQDLQFELDNHVLPKKITYVYQNLLRASKHHLRVFTKILKGNGVKYIPQILAPDVYQVILEN